jgi:hypothetical protein
VLGRLILKGEVKDGDIVTVDKEPKGEGLKFNVRRRAEEQKISSTDVNEKASAA